MPNGEAAHLVTVGSVLKRNSNGAFVIVTAINKERGGFWFRSRNYIIYADFSAVHFGTNPDWKKTGFSPTEPLRLAPAVPVKPAVTTKGLQPEKRKRNNEWRRLYEDEGLSSIEIAEKYNVTRERVCQILRKTNNIAKKQERRQRAREEIAKEYETFKAGMLDVRKTVISEVLDLVCKGHSVISACGQTDAAKRLYIRFSSAVNLMNYECKKANVESKHHRKLRFSQLQLDAIKERIKNLRGSGFKWSVVLSELHKEGFDRVSHIWITKHFPEFINSRTESPLPVKKRKEKYVVRARNRIRRLKNAYEVLKDLGLSDNL